MNQLPQRPLRCYNPDKYRWDLLVWNVALARRIGMAEVQVLQGRAARSQIKSHPPRLQTRLLTAWSAWGKATSKKWRHIRHHGVALHANRGYSEPLTEL